MRYIEMSIEDAIKKCKKNATVLVATQDLTDDDVEIVFVKRKGNESDELFSDVKTVASLSDDLVKQLNLFTEKQDIMNIRPYGIKRVIILRE